MIVTSPTDDWLRKAIVNSMTALRSDEREANSARTVLVSTRQPDVVCEALSESDEIRADIWALLPKKILQRRLSVVTSQSLKR